MLLVGAGRLWLLRVGLYKLTRPKQHADDWVWIIDHSVQTGPEKCLLILGIRLSRLRANSCCLRHEEMEPIAFCPVRKSNGDVVYQQLEDAVKLTGVPREILSDHGSDLRAGIGQFCQQHPHTSAVYDITHKTATLVKAFLTYDSTWEEFCRFAAQMKQQVQQTDLAVLAAPAQRTNARYMNVERLGRWAVQVLDVLDEEANQFATHAGAEKVTGLTTFRQALEVWNTIFDVIQKVEQTVRQYGFQPRCVTELEGWWTARMWLPHVTVFGETLLEFVRSESAKARPGERLVGSSEVIESVFGKLKHIEGAQSKQGFTGLVLSAAAIVAPTTVRVIQEALETVSTADVQTWCRDVLGSSVQSQRKTLFSSGVFSGTKVGSTKGSEGG